jgi:hypothetical protein
MLFVENDDVIEQFPPASTDPALGHPILPRTLVTGPQRLNPDVTESVMNLGRED